MHFAGTQAGSGATKKKATVEKLDGEPKNVDDHPFAQGAMLLVKWGADESPRLCQIIERGPCALWSGSQSLTRVTQHIVVTTIAQMNPEEEDPARQYRYYVHYLDVRS